MREAGRVRARGETGTDLVRPKGAGWPWGVTTPGLPQIRTCAINASGSSDAWVRYVGRNTE